MTSTQLPSIGGDFALKVDIEPVVGYLGALSRQVPFAVSSGINALMKIGQTRQQQHDRQVFTVRRTQFIDRTVKILAFASKSHMVGIIGIDPQRNVLAKFEDGGTKRAASGMLAIPIMVRRSKSDVVVANMRVRALRLTPYTTASGVTRLRGLQRTFTIKNAKGGAILQRVGRKPKGSTIAEEIAAGSLRVAYAFRRSVPLPPDLHFRENMVATANGEWDRVMSEAWAYAVRTAR